MRRTSERLIEPSWRALEAFVAVAEGKSFSAAARRLGVSASALSQSVRGLEEQLGAPLLVRTTRAVNVTEAGQRRQAGADGLGLAYVAEWAAAPLLKKRRLEVVLTDWACAVPGLFISFPRRAQETPPLRAFLDTAKELLPR